MKGQERAQGGRGAQERNAAHASTQAQQPHHDEGQEGRRGTQPASGVPGGLGDRIDQLIDALTQDDQDEQTQPLGEMFDIDPRQPLFAGPLRRPPLSRGSRINRCGPLVVPSAWTAVAVARRDRHGEEQVGRQTRGPQPRPCRLLRPEGDDPRRDARREASSRPALHPLVPVLPDTAGDETRHDITDGERPAPVPCLHAMHGRCHDGQARHAQEQGAGSRGLRGHVAVQRVGDPYGPERSEQHHVQAYVPGGGVAVEQVGELRDTRDRHEVEEQLQPRGMPSTCRGRNERFRSLWVHMRTVLLAKRDPPLSGATGVDASARAAALATSWLRDQREV
ncbi:hypothetical protein RKD46_000187 [Streptomyces pseudovenezuelae]